MIDLSDGLATDAGHLAAGERRRAAPARSTRCRAPAGVRGRPTAATGGDDYELLFTIAPERREAAEAAAPVSWLGDVAPGSGVVLLDADGRPVERAAGLRARVTSGRRRAEHRLGDRVRVDHVLAALRSRRASASLLTSCSSSETYLLPARPLVDIGRTDSRASASAARWTTCGARSRGRAPRAGRSGGSSGAGAGER